MAAGGGRHYQPPARVGLRDRAGEVLRGVARRAIEFAYSPPAVPGVGSGRPWFNLPRDKGAESALHSREALYGRATYRLGPVQSYISTYPGSGLTPERIAAIHNEVLVVGYMLNKACLDEQILLRDAHLQAVDRARRVDVTGCDLSFEPADDSKLSQQLADYDETWIRDIHRFGSACYELLFANAAGYALEEAVFEERDVQVLTEIDGKPQHVTISGPHPRQLDWVSNKHTRFDVEKDELLLDAGNGSFFSLPEHKFLIHVVDGDFQKRRRGYMYQAVWLHLLKHAAMARWGVVLDIWGIPVPHGKLDQQLWQDETRKAESRAILRDAGLGKPFLTTDDFEIEKAFELSSGDARGMHAALIGWANQEMSKLVQGETLTTELGGVGGYNTSQTHADVKEAIVQQDALALASSVRAWIKAVHELNMPAICKAFGARPEQIRRMTPIPYWRIARAVTPQVGLDMVAKAVNELRLPVSLGATMRQYGFPRARTVGDQIKGQTEVIPKGAKAADTITAGDGAADNPEPEKNTDGNRI
jgi:hypothetical protein